MSKTFKKIAIIFLSTVFLLSVILLCACLEEKEKLIVSVSDEADIGANDRLDYVKSFLTVSVYDGKNYNTVSDYELVGTLTEGESKLTVTYGEYSQGFTVTVQKERLITVTFDSSCGTADTITDLAPYSKIQEPAVPENSGFTFGGWFTDPNFKTRWNFDRDTAIKDTVLYAKWGQPNYKLVMVTNQSSAQVDLMQKAIDKFQSKFPKWSVEVKQKTTNETQNEVNRLIDNGQTPDIVLGYPHYLSDFIRSGKVLDLNEFINSTELVEGTKTYYTTGYSSDELKDFMPGVYSEAKAENVYGYAEYGYDTDGLLALPFVKTTEYMFYNKTLLDELNLQPAVTWDEMWEQCKVIKAAHPDVTPFAYDSDVNFFLNSCYQNGWDFVSYDGGLRYGFDGADHIGWLNGIKSNYDKGYFTTTGLSGNYSSGAFTLGKVAYSVCSSAALSYYLGGNKSFEIGVSTVPVVENSATQKNVARVNGPSLYAFESNEVNYKERETMAFMFIKELLDSEFMAEYAAASSYAPSRLTSFVIMEQALCENNEAESFACALVAQATMAVSYTLPICGDTNYAFTEITNAIQNAMFGSLTPEQALCGAVDKCNEHGG